MRWLSSLPPNFFCHAHILLHISFHSINSVRVRFNLVADLCHSVTHRFIDKPVQMFHDVIDFCGVGVAEFKGMGSGHGFVSTLSVNIHGNTNMFDTIPGRTIFGFLLGRLDRTGILGELFAFTDEAACFCFVDLLWEMLS